MKIKLIVLSILVSIAIAGMAFKTNEQKSAIKWVSITQATEMSKKDKRKIFIDVYTDWCGWCKVMDKKTFSNENIAQYVNKKYYAVKLDAESQTEIVYKGQKMTEAELASRIYRVNSYPTTLYLDENFDILSPVQGYLELPMFTKIIKFYGDEHYKKQSWEDFDKTFKP